MDFYLHDLLYNNKRDVTPKHFLNSEGCRMLDDAGEPGMEGVTENGTSAELMLARYASESKSISGFAELVR